jgi:hypothetical protein
VFFFFFFFFSVKEDLIYFEVFFSLENFLILVQFTFVGRYFF